MIPVKPAPEPELFDEEVRRPGQAFLKQLGVSKNIPSQIQIPWSRGRFWSKCADSLEKSYNHICCYVAIKINGSNSHEKRSVEHFIPKSISPWLAYEWSNLRLACRKANSNRGTKPVIDPFLVKPDDFRLDLFTFELFPNPELAVERQNQIRETIYNIDLNNDYWKKIMQKYYLQHIENIKLMDSNASNKFLFDNAPIVLAEVQRLPKKIIVEDD